jgi:hypothetical protein
MIVFISFLYDGSHTFFHTLTKLLFHEFINEQLKEKETLVELMKGMFGSELSVNERPSLDRQQSSFS